MLEESVSSSPTFWAALFSWFTPTVFFVVLQLVIGTIYITSTLANNHKNHHQEQQQQQDPQQQQQQQQLLRSPSLLQRFKSINLYSYFPTEPLSHNLATTNDTNVSNTTITYEPEDQLQQQQHVYNMAVVEKDEVNEEDDVVGKILFQHNLKEHELPEQGGYIARTQSDTKPTSGEVTVKLPKKMKKSASSKSAFSHFKEDEVVESRRPATMREKKASGSAEEDVEVDAKADDFINKFKQQLKLQRLDSIMRKEVIGD
ncbi:PREDICTED: ubiquitin carboxyl-terminal hydrolase 36-like isoform X2 [Lupinus angustifolius]|uniref:ubiquitin carboxyl-terminal hydrolase 36-like isoform X2 n=1 Tax=Lupinus angustifolius TaxID=3871 RepID=UPI00092EC08F|nr:PREDICTED: ubiquitin carboxyl-terminal hydrolase 36-like isoform X2 [Lupinus angustifolius]